MFNNFFHTASISLSIPEDQLRYMSCILLTYPLALIYIKYLVQKQSNLKIFYSIITTLFLFIFVHNQIWGVYNLFASCIITYLILIYCNAKLASKYIFVWAMAHMSYTHLYRQITHYGQVQMDYSGPQMVWTIKLTMFAFNLYDGQRDISKLTPYQIEHRIANLPSFIEFLGYILFFPGFFVGPALDYYDYSLFLKAKNFKGDSTKEKHIPSTLLPAFKCFLGSLVFALFPIFVMPYVNVSLLITPEFPKHSFFYRFLLILIIPTLERTKYYFAWLLSEGACILSGLGYLGQDKDGYEIWGGVTNINILKVELPENIKMAFDNWNIATNQWLRNYIYLRLAPSGTKDTFLPQLATFFVSAFWHGFYPGYYLFLVFAGFVNEAGRLLRRNIRPVIISTNSNIIKKLYDVSSMILAIIYLNYMSVPFLTLTLVDTFNVFKSVYFCLHIACFATIFFFKFGGSKFFPKSKINKIQPTSLDPTLHESNKDSNDKKQS